MGIPDRVVEHGKPSELHAECNYDAAAIVGVVQKMLGTGTRELVNEIAG